LDSSGHAADMDMDRFSSPFPGLAGRIGFLIVLMLSERLMAVAPIWLA
jgi:hypothetical protein